MRAQGGRAVDKVKVEAFLSVPPCSGGVNLTRLLDQISAEFGDRVDISITRGPTEQMEERNLTAAPALIVGDLVRFMGLCPSKESLISALREAGMD